MQTSSFDQIGKKSLRNLTYFSRPKYDPKKDLGPSTFTLGKKPMQRIDFDVFNTYKEAIKCSIFTPKKLRENVCLHRFLSLMDIQDLSLCCCLSWKLWKSKRCLRIGRSLASRRHLSLLFRFLWVQSTLLASCLNEF